MKQAHILIVDDDTALLQALPQAIQLRLPEVQVDTSDSAFAALDLVREHKYDAIVSDIKMPGMDGLALLAKIQELRPATPTLLITGHGDHSLAIQALRGGAYDFIQKPIDRDYFVAALYRAIQTHQLRQQVAEQQQALEAHAKSLEQIVLERTRELVEANAAKDEFLSIASHELKTPLSSLKGMTQLLRRRLERAGSSEASYLANMENSIRRMEVLVNDLLNISFVEMGIFALHCSCCDMGALCRRLIEEYIAGTNPHPVVTLDIIPDEPVEVEVDVDRIGQVIINLLSNARKYSSPNAPIRVTVERNGGECKVSVHDSGIGIAPEVLPRVFERFYRVPDVEVQTGSSVGFGLGLYISKQIVEHHGGRIEVQSVLDTGSVFSIVLPLIRSNEADTELDLLSEAQ
ncbi:MAG: response regulator [Ktedonobacteraceae bacterium]|nr:response regulator [Ktedonobacteraceae bacterium]MBV9712727.1 response regulator [Ktedonobacteraceae bacterium]